MYVGLGFVEVINFDLKAGFEVQKSPFVKKGGKSPCVYFGLKMDFESREKVVC